MAIQRLSPYQFSILKAMHAKPLAFESAIEFNQINFYSLIRRGFIHLVLQDETFRLTDSGATAYSTYVDMKTDSMIVQNNPPARVERVSIKLQGKRPKKSAARASKTTAAA